MLHRSVTLMRRSSWTRSKVSRRGVNVLSRFTLLHRQHALDGRAGPRHQFGRQFHAWLQIAQRVAQLFERIALHVGTLAAIALLVSNEIKFLAGRQLLKRVTDAALGHDDELLGILSGAPIDDGRG